ncbi:MAG TPA: hypothetical protein ENN73_06265 [Firmicutes bacterium]|nr:hypothetical protein [Bacillota bacterium]
MTIKFDRDIFRGVSVIKRLNEAFFTEDLFNFKGLPEENLPSGMSRGSPEHLLYITFISAIAYLREEGDLWSSARAAWEDKHFRYLFNPSELSIRPVSEIENDLRKAKLLCTPQELRPTSFKDLISGDKRFLRENDFELWMNMSRALNCFGSKVESLFDAHNFDALAIFKIFTETPLKNSFPEYRKDRKVIIWLARVERNARFPVLNMIKIPMAGGKHIHRATFMTGCIWGELNSLQVELDHLIINYWHEVAETGKKSLNISPIQFQVYLWILSKFGCKPGKPDGDGDCFNKRACPVKEFCVSGTVVIREEFTQIDTKLSF